MIKNTRQKQHRINLCHTNLCLFMSHILRINCNTFYYKAHVQQLLSDDSELKITTVDQEL